MSELWATPQALFDKLNEEFNFVLDVCALPNNKKCTRFFSPDMDGLSQEWIWWGGRERKMAIWMNPPYGRTIALWMKKAYEAAMSGETVVCLIPNRSNAPWWHDYVMKAAEIRFIKHKVAFDAPEELYEQYGVGVPFWGSVIVVFRPGFRPGFDEPKVSTYLQPKHEAKAAPEEMFKESR